VIDLKWKINQVLSLTSGSSSADFIASLVQYPSTFGLVSGNGTPGVLLQLILTATIIFSSVPYCGGGR
jgi:hypothetical protein